MGVFMVVIPSKKKDKYNASMKYENYSSYDYKLLYMSQLTIQVRYIDIVSGQYIVDPIIVG